MRGILGRGNQQLIPTIKTHKMKKDEMLVARLDFLIPMNFFLSQEWQLMFGVDSKIAIGRVVELNPKWVIEVVNNLEHRLTDVLHDFKGIYAEDEHFLPRIQAEDIMSNQETKIREYLEKNYCNRYNIDNCRDEGITVDVCENGDVVYNSVEIIKTNIRAEEFNCEMCSKSMDEKEHDFSDICDDCREQDDSEDIIGDFDENGDAVDVKVNGYTNIETYRLCLVLDNTEYWKEDILQTFFRLVREDEFSANDINIIDWNEVIKRYSDDLIETNIHHHNE